MFFKILQLKYQMKIVQRNWQRFAQFNAQYQANKNKNAVRFEAQNLSWDYEVTEYHTKAFAKGLKSIKFAENDNFLIRVPASQQAEAYVAKVATANINANLIISQANNVDELDQELSQHKINGLLFEPTLPLGEDLLAIDGLYKLMPELRGLEQGSPINAKKYSNLRMLIQTNFYSYPGVFKYRSIFNYSKDEYTSFNGSEKHSPISLPKSDNTIVITQPAHDFAFRAGTLNSLVNGRYVVVAEPQDVSRIAHIMEEKIDLIATEDCPVPDQANIFVEKGSKLFSSHPNRSEL